MVKKWFPLLFILLNISSSFSQTVIFNENFTNGLPSGWTNYSNIGSHIWTFDSPSDFSFPTSMGSKVMVVDSDGIGPGFSQNTSVTTSSFDCSNLNNIILSFDYTFASYYSGESCRIEVFNGNNWNTVFYLETGDDNHPNVDLVNLDITSATGNYAQAQIRFTYIASYGYWWAIDNLVLQGTVVNTTPPDTKGPGGVGNTNMESKLEAWYRPNSIRNTSNQLPSDGQIVNQWLDNSYNSHHLNNQGVAKYESGSSDLINGNAKLAASNLDRDFKTSQHLTAQTLVVVNNPGTGNSFEGLIGLDNDKGIRRPSGGNSYWQHPGGSGGVNDDTWSSTNGGSYINGGTSISGTHNNTLHFISQIRPTTETQRLYVGGYFSGRGFTGEICEVLVFNQNLSMVEQIILNNYLSAKYDIPLAANDFYNEDNSADGNYDYNVAGIGMHTDGSTQSSAQGTGIVKISNPSHLVSDEYLFWGENNSSPDYSFHTASDYLERQNTTWRVSRRNNPGKLTVQVNANDLDLTAKQECAPLFLIVSDFEDFSVKTKYEMTLDNDVYTAQNVVLKNNRYFTFEYQDLIVADNSIFYNGQGSAQSPNLSDGCYKLLIKNTNTNLLTLTQDAEVREVELENGATLTITSNIFLNSHGSIKNNGTLNMENKSSLIQDHSGANQNSGSGLYNIKRSGAISSNFYNIWSSPISQQVLTSVFNSSNACNIFTYDQSLQEWRYDYPIGHTASCGSNSVTFSTGQLLPNADGIMDIGRGYFVPGISGGIRQFSGTINNGDILVPIKATTINNPGGIYWTGNDWNLIGNPYPSSINAIDFWNENASNNYRITDALYFWDGIDTASGYNQFQDYASWNLTGGVNSGNSSVIPSGQISSGQGFWVTARSTTHVKFSNSMRTSNNSQFFKTLPDSNNQHNAWFSFTSPSGNTNNILIGYSPITTDTHDLGYDAHKLEGNAHIKLASLLDSAEYVIQSVSPPRVGNTKVIPLFVFSDESGIHTFSNYRLKRIPENLNIYLKDNDLEISHDLRANDYEVYLTANQSLSNRFQLEFSPNLEINTGGNGSKNTGNNPDTDTTEVVTSIPSEINRIFSVSVQKNVIHISSTETIEGEITLTNTAGKIVSTTPYLIGSKTASITTSGISSGLYILNIRQNSRNYSKSIFIP